MPTNYIFYEEKYPFYHRREIDFKPEEVLVESVHPPEKCFNCYFFYRTPKAPMKRRRFTIGFYFTCKKTNQWLFHREIVDNDFLWHDNDYRKPPMVSNFPNVILINATLGKFIDGGSRFQKKYFVREYFGQILKKEDCPGFLDRTITIREILEGRVDPLGKIKKLTKATKDKLLAQISTLKIDNADGLPILL